MNILGPTFKSGDHAVLTIGGPIMLIETDTGEDNEPQTSTVSCVWLDTTNRLQRAVFPRTFLRNALDGRP